MDYYLKFTNEAEATATLYHSEDAVEANHELGIEADPGHVVPNYRNIDTIGVIYEQQIITDPENPPTPIPLDGWHVNVRLVEGEDAAPLVAYAVSPSTPMRVWG